MLIELAVRDLGVIADARIPFGDGMTALTGETGAGKTMVVEALHLLAGGRADPSRVRAGAGEAVVEGLFAAGDTEWVLRRAVPAEGRSRCYLNGELTTAANLEQVAGGLLEIHGQHSQQALLSARHQRDALDRYAGVDTGRLQALRRELRELSAELEHAGGDGRERIRRAELLAHEIGEIRAIAPVPGEDEALSEEEDLLTGAVDLREAAAEALSVLSGEGGIGDRLAAVTHRLGDHRPLSSVHSRLKDVEAELVDCGREIRGVSEAVEPDDERLEEIRRRRQDLAGLRRKYGDTIEAVLEFARRCADELAELESTDARRAELADRIESVRAELEQESARVGRRRRAAAPALCGEVMEILDGLALPAEVEVAVEDSEGLPGAGESVEIRIAANKGGRPGPLSKVASGGELSRVMLALRLVLSGGPPTMVFDEVDAGVGGEAAVAVGRALADLGADRQVIVVTHLAQVAAAAAHQVAVDKSEPGPGTSPDSATTTELRVVRGAERVVEISRMLSGSPDSATAREHAQELLASSGAAE